MTRGGHKWRFSSENFCGDATSRTLRNYPHIRPSLHHQATITPSFHVNSNHQNQDDPNGSKLCCVQVRATRVVMLQLRKRALQRCGGKDHYQLLPISLHNIYITGPLCPRDWKDHPLNLLCCLSRSNLSLRQPWLSQLRLLQSLCLIAIGSWHQRPPSESLRYVLEP